MNKKILYNRNKTITFVLIIYFKMTLISRISFNWPCTLFFVMLFSNVFWAQSQPKETKDPNTMILLDKAEKEREREKEGKDPKAMALLDKATAAFDSRKGLAADFIITVENVRESTKKESLSGKVWLKGEKFKLFVKEVETYFDGKTQSVYMKEDNEVTISTPDAKELEEINPLLLIKSYRKGYKMKFLESTQTNGKSLDIIDLYPENVKESTVSRITFSIEKESMRLYSVRIQGKDGINTTFSIKKYDNTPLSDTMFSFDPQNVAGIEIVDLR